MFLVSFRFSDACHQRSAACWSGDFVNCLFVAKIQFLAKNERDFKEKVAILANRCYATYYFFKIESKFINLQVFANLFLRNFTRFNILANFSRINFFRFNIRSNFNDSNFLQSYKLQYSHKLFTNQLFFVPIFAQTFTIPIFCKLTRFQFFAIFSRIKISLIHFS